MRLSFIQKDMPYVITAFLLIQAFSILLASRVVNFHSQQITLLGIMIPIVALINFAIVLAAVYWLNNMFTLNKILTTMNENLKILRSERHDFINHLMSIHGLIAADEYKSVIDYIKLVNQDYRNNSQMLNISNLYLRTLLQKKKDESESLGIKFKLVVTSRLTHFKMDPKSITVVFGNLLDNAIDAVKDSTGKKQITFEINELKFQYVFIVSDSGEPIKPEVREKMFEVGYSTKGENRGYGLELIKRAIIKNQGQLVFDDSNEKQFKVLIPKTEREF